MVPVIRSWPEWVGVYVAVYVPLLLSVTDGVAVFASATEMDAVATPLDCRLSFWSYAVTVLVNWVLGVTGEGLAEIRE